MVSSDPGRLSQRLRHRLDRTAASDDRGFTLIELLVVVVIIGILIAIAIPLYLNYKKGANDKAAQSDLRNAISVLETCNSDYAGYPTGPTALSGTPTGCTSQNVSLSTGTSLKYYPKSDSTAYLLLATNSGGTTSSGKYYCYSSAAGGSVVQKTATLPTAFATSC